MDFSELVQQRQSVRKYKDQPVEKAKIETCIEALRLAPSACNGQPWKALVVEEPRMRGNIAGCVSDMMMNKFVHQAPVLVVLIMKKTNFTSWFGSKVKKKAFPLMDVGIAAEHFCLQAAELGLGTCLIGWFQEKAMKKILKLSGNQRIGLVITLGYPPDDYPVRSKIRKSTEEICEWYS